jgi:hypothetical protein
VQHLAQDLGARERQQEVHRGARRGSAIERDPDRHRARAERHHLARAERAARHPDLEESAGDRAQHLQHVRGAAPREAHLAARGELAGIEQDEVHRAAG